MTMSCEAERNTTSSAMAANKYGASVGELKPITPMATAKTGLKDHDPTAAPAEKGRQVAIEQGRPQEFEDVGQTHERVEADGLQVDACGRQPRLKGKSGSGQIEGQPRGEAHQQHGHDAFVAQRLAERGLGLFRQRKAVFVTMRIARDNISAHDRGVSK